MAKGYTPQKKHAPIDNDVELPAAIRAASLRSDALHKAMYEQTPPAAPDADNPPATPPATPPAEETNGNENTPPPPKESEVKTPPAQTPPTTPPASGAEDWEHKYKSLKPRFDQQNSTISSLTHRIGEMEALIARLDEKPAAAAPTPPELTFKPIGADERETYGEDFIDVAQRAAMEKVSPEISRLSQQLTNLQKQLGTVATSTAVAQKQNIYTFLDSKLTNWREINKNPDFLAWANLSDPFSGVTRIEMLREAFNKGDGPRVLNFFQGFLKDEAVTDPASVPKPELKTPEVGKIPLETFAAPGRARAPAATPPPAPGEKETISRAQIAQFYRNKAQGKYRGNPEVEADLERRIFEAERDGRIV